MKKKNKLEAYVKIEKSTILYFTDDQGHHWIQGGNCPTAGQVANKAEALIKLEEYRIAQLKNNGTKTKTYIV